MKAHFRDNAQKSEVHRAHRSRAETGAASDRLVASAPHANEQSQLDSRQLRDVGLDEQPVRRESSKSSWQE